MLSSPSSAIYKRRRKAGALDQKEFKILDIVRAGIAYSIAAIGMIASSIGLFNLVIEIFNLPLSPIFEPIYILFNEIAFLISSWIYFNIPLLSPQVSPQIFLFSLILVTATSRSAIQYVLFGERDALYRNRAQKEKYCEIDGPNYDEEECERLSGFKTLFLGNPILATIATYGPSILAALLLSIPFVGQMTAFGLFSGMFILIIGTWATVYVRREWGASWREIFIDHELFAAGVGFYLSGCIIGAFVMLVLNAFY